MTNENISFSHFDNIPYGATGEGAIFTNSSEVAHVEKDTVLIRISIKDGALDVYLKKNGEYWIVRQAREDE